MRVNFNVINQKNVPALQSGLILPAPGQVGRIFYNAAGVGMYIDDGTAWLPITTGGGGGVGTLQQVTDLGNTTDKNINLDGSSLFINDGGSSKVLAGNNLGGAVGEVVLNLPDGGGTIPISVNGTFADNFGNIELSESVPTIQQVLGAGNVTTTNVIFDLAGVNFKDNFFTKIIYGSRLGAPAFGGEVFYLPDDGGTIPISVNGNLADNNGNITLLYRSALTNIGKSVDLVPATTAPVQRLIFTGTTSVTGTTTISLAGYNISLLLNLYGTIDIGGNFNTTLNYFDAFEAGGDSYRTKALIYYRSNTNNIQIEATTGIIGSESAIVSPYTVVIEFQQV